MAWTQFWDMSSGGCGKLSWEQIFIEAPEEEAKLIFFNRFGKNPDDISCACCGTDYSIHEYATLREATAYQRNCAWDNDHAYIEEPRADYNCELITLFEYVHRPDVTVVYADQIKPEERKGELPEPYRAPYADEPYDDDNDEELEDNPAE